MKKSWWVPVLYILTFSTQALADWPMFQANPQHNGQAGVVAAQTGHIQWSRDLGANISPLGGPSVGQYNGETQIVVGADDAVYVINRDGTLTQRISSSLPITTVVAIADGTLYFGAGSGLYACRPTALYWAHAMNYDVTHVTIFGGKVYVCDRDRLWVYDLDGTLAWSSDDLSGTITQSAPAVDTSGNVYVVSSASWWHDYNLYAFHANGVLWWSYDYMAYEFGGVQMTPTLDSSANVYFGTYWSNLWSSQMHCLRDDVLNWHQDTKALHSSPAIAGNMLYYGTDEGLVAQHVSGAYVWLYPTISPIRHSSPAVGSDGTIYVGTEDGFLLAITPLGVIKWISDLLDGSVGSPAIGDDGTVYVTAGSFLYAFGQDGVSVDEGELQSGLELGLYPNPCSQRVQASYYLASAGPVKVMIYDVTGRLVRAVLDQDQGRGEHRLEIAGLASGVYLVRVQSGQDQATRRLVVIK